MYTITLWSVYCQKLVSVYVCSTQFVFNWLVAKLIILRYKGHLKITKKKKISSLWKIRKLYELFLLEGFEFGYFDENLRISKLFIFD